MMSKFEQGNLLDLLVPEPCVVRSRQVLMPVVTDSWKGGVKTLTRNVQVWWVWDCSCGRSTKPGTLFGWEGGALEMGGYHAAGEF